MDSWGDTFKKTATPTTTGWGATFNRPDPQKIAQENAQYAQEAKQANSFTGLLGNTISDLTGKYLPGVKALGQSIATGSLGPEKQFLNEAVKNNTPQVRNAQGNIDWNNPENVKAITNFGMVGAGADLQAVKGAKVVSGLTTKEATQAGTERAHVTAYKDATNVAPEIAQQAGEQAGTILPRSTSKLSEEVRGVISSNIDEALNIAKGNNDKAIAMGDALVEHFSTLANQATDAITKQSYIDQAVPIAVDTATKLTEQGRAIQAASILAKTTPSGFVRWAVNQAKNGGYEIPDEVMTDLLTGATNISKMAEGEAKNRAIFDLANKVKALSPSSMWDKIVTVWKAGLLTGVKTSGLNTLSNFFHGVAETVKEVPATMADAVMSFGTGERTKALTLRGYISGGENGIKKGWDYIKTGYDPREFDSKLDWNKVNFGKGPIGKFFQKYTDLVFRVLGAEDQPFYYGASAHSLYSQAIAEAKNAGLKGAEKENFINKFVSNPTEEAINNAVIDATTAVFQQDTRIGKLASGIVNTAKNISPSTGAAVELIMPFRKTPAGVAMQIFNYTPAGFIGEIAKQIESGHFNQKAFADAIGRSATGVGVMYLGSKLFDKGIITLAYPTDPKEQARWDAEGRKENSILIDGKWRGLNTFGPPGNVIVLGGYYQKALQETGSQSSALAKTILTVPKTVLDQTFLKGFSSAIDALQQPDRYLETFVNGLAGSTVPTIVSDVAQATDPLQRRVGTDLSLQSTGEAIKARVPGLRETLPPKITALGQERQRIGNSLETLFDPSRPSISSSEPIIREGDRLAAQGYEVLPTKLGGKNGYNSLSDEENTQLLKMRGQLFKDKMSKVIEMPDYQTLTDKEKANIFNDFASKAADYARAKIIYDKIKGQEGETLKTSLKTFKKDGLLTQDVFKILEENL